MLKKLALGLFTVAVALVAAEDSALAQTGGMGGMNMQRPRRQLRRSRAPVLSPALNLLPGAAQSFEGQFLLRQLPQEQALRNFRQTERSLDRLQQEVTDQDNQIQTGLKKTTGHRTQFMNYGGYYSLGRGGGGRR